MGLGPTLPVAAPTSGCLSQVSTGLDPVNSRTAPTSGQARWSQASDGPTPAQRLPRIGTYRRTASEAISAECQQLEGLTEQPSVLEALAAESRTQGRSDRERSFSQSLVCRTSAWPQRSRQSGLGLSSGHSREHPTRSCLRFARCEDTTTPSRSLGSQPSTHDLAQPYGISAMELLYKLSPKLASAKQKVVWQSRRQRACDSSSLPAALICKAKCSTRSRNRCRGRTTDSVAHSRAVVAKQGEGSECMAGSCVCRRLRQVERSTRKHVGGSVDLHVVSTDI